MVAIPPEYREMLSPAVAEMIERRIKTKHDERESNPTIWTNYVKLFADHSRIPLAEKAA